MAQKLFFVFFSLLGHCTVSQMDGAWVLNSKFFLEYLKLKPFLYEDGILTTTAYLQHVLSLSWTKNYLVVINFTLKLIMRTENVLSA